MNKIDFKNLPDTSTPLSAENLNLLQNNVEDAIDNVSIDLDDEVSTTSTNGIENQAITNYVNTGLGTLTTSLNNLKNFSTTEQVIGTWVDGKPLYRQVLHKTLSGATNQVVGTINNVDLMIFGGASVIKYDSGGTNYYTGSPNSYETSSNWTKTYTMINRSTHTCNVYWNGSEAGEIWVECLYTKSTD